MPPFSEDVVVNVSPITVSVPLDRRDSHTTTVVDDTALLLTEKDDDENTITSVLVQPVELSPQPPTTTTTIYGRRTITIETRIIAMYYIETLDEYTDEEMDACWYNQEELMAIKADNNRMIREEASGRLQSDKDTVRGLESQKHHGYMALRTIRDSSISAVLAEQYRQRQQQRGRGIGGQMLIDPERIRDSYICISIRAYHRARDVAHMDALEALRIQTDPLTWRFIQIEDSTRNCCFFHLPLWIPQGTHDAMVTIPIGL